MSFLSTVKLKYNAFIVEGENRKYIVIALLAIGCIFYAFSSGSSSESSETEPVKQKDKKQVSFFSTEGADKIEHNQLNGIMDQMERQVAERERQVDEREGNTKAMEARVMAKIDALTLSQNQIQRELKLQEQEFIKRSSQQTKAKQTPVFGRQPSPTPGVSSPTAAPAPAASAPLQGNGLRMVAQGGTQMNLNPQNSHVGARTVNAKGDSWIDASGKLTVNSGPVSTAVDDKVFSDLTEDGTEQEEEADTEIFIPAGTMISGIMITGMDVPTGSSSTRDPYPAILRVKEEALMPNNFSADITDCILLTSAKGDLSSRRAIFRTEAISCVTDEGKAVEANLTAFSVGKDGKTGISGKLVTRNTEVALQSAMTGFLAGMADIFSTTAVSVGDQETGVFSVFNDPTAMANLAGSSALKGSAAGLERLSEYYIELVEEMKPYLEVNPGITVDFIVQRGTSLKIK